jgi:hypothetical protein
MLAIAYMPDKSTINYVNYGRTLWLSIAIRELVHLKKKNAQLLLLVIEFGHLKGKDVTSHIFLVIFSAVVPHDGKSCEYQIN